MNIYLDLCCLHRPFDDQTQEQIRLEAEAVLEILGRIESREWQWVASSVALHEIGRIPDPERRNRLRSLVGCASRFVVLNEEIFQQAERLTARGFGAFEALHLACAVQGDVEHFLTTDGALIERAATADELAGMRVQNPRSLLSERE